MTEEERKIQDKFKKKEVASVVSLIKGDPTNFDVYKSYVGGYSLGVWQRVPSGDVQTFCNYQTEADRDHDLNLLLELTGAEESKS